MKKATMILLLAIGMMATASAQKDSSKAYVKSSGDLVFTNGSPEVLAKWSPKDSTLKVLDYKAIKLIEIGGKKINPLALVQAEILFTYPEWIVTVFNILETATTGLSKAQLTQLQQLLVPYIQLYQQEAQEKARPKKQD